MKLSKLDPALRENLRNLLQGYVEHCEMSDTLIARIETPIYYHGFKFGAPVFTHRHPSANNHSRTIGIAGINEPSCATPSEIVLQIVEMLAQQPGIGGSGPIELMPVANPVALELGESAPRNGDWPILDHLLEEFRARASGGFIAIHSSVDDGFSLTGEATPQIFHHIASAAGTSRSLRQVNLQLVEGAWSLRLTVPASASAGTVLAASRLALALIRPC